MASLFPFRAPRYDPHSVRLADVVTQPYDKITPTMQARYYAASPYNLVRLILGDKAVEGDVYAAAARYLETWRADGILKTEDKAALYAYSQEFPAPGEGTLIRRSFIALGQLEDYDRGIVFRHEQTLSGPKADRLNLLRATRAHLEQLFFVYSDPQHTVESLLFATRAPDAEVTDEYGVVHRLWPVSDPQVIAKVQAAMCDKKLLIADGHHRYETALTYRNERRAAAGEGARLDAAYERVMMTLVNMDSEGLVILPTHRVVHSLSMFDPEQLLRGAKRFFEVEPLPSVLAASAATTALAAGNGDMRFVAFCGERNFLFRARSEAIATQLADLSPRQHALDVVVLHRVLLQQVLGISEAAIREQRNLNYVRDAGEALERVRSGSAEVAFLMNPVTIEQMREVSFAGEVMPQKSTDFYPKMLSGLVNYALE